MQRVDAVGWARTRTGRPRGAAGSSWPLRTGRGTSSGTMGIRWAQTAGGAMMRQSPEPCARALVRIHPHLFPGEPIISPPVRYV
jgi:hypothetical protein